MKTESLGNAEPLGHGHTVRSDAAGICIQIPVNVEHSQEQCGVCEEQSTEVFLTIKDRS